MNMISVTGRSPVIAAPTAAPRNPVSEIGAVANPVGSEAGEEPFRGLKGPFGDRDVFAKDHHDEDRASISSLLWPGS